MTIEPPRPAPEGERRWTAVLLADMVNYSEVSNTVGPEKAYALISRVVDLAVREIEAHGGKVLSFGGDSVLASFGAPVAMEDASLQSCRAALAFLKALDQEGDALTRQFGARPQFRVGVSGGMVVLGNLGLGQKMDLGIMGQPVIEASRLEAIAEPGQVLLSAPLHAEVEGSTRTRPIGAHRLKGLSGPVEVFELLSVPADAPRFLSSSGRGLVALIGRADELDRLDHALGREAPGRRSALLTGAAGLGKSRLVHALTTRLEGRMRVVLGQCSPLEQAAPFHPFVHILRQLSGAAPGASGAETISALEKALAGRRSAAALGPVFRGGPDAASPGELSEGEGATILNAMAEVLELLVRDEPALIVIEDAHWIDSSSRRLLERLLRADSTYTAPLLITARPGPQMGWAAEASACQIDLRPLNAGESAALAAAHLARGPVSPALARRVHEISEGSPLVAEQFLRALITADALTDTDEGIGIKPGSNIDMTSGNLQNLVMRQFDSLGPTARRLLQKASVAGRDFSEAVLDGPDTGSAAPHLQEAAEAGLVQRAGEDGQSWRFSHALLRDVIHGSVLEEQRCKLHLEIARTLEAGGADSEVLAYHFDRGRDRRQAVRYLIAAGRKSLRLYDLGQVDANFSRAQDYLQRDPGLAPDADYNQMAIGWLQALTIRGDMGRAIRIGRVCLPRVEASGDEPSLDMAQAYYAAALAHARDYGQGLRICEAGIARAEARGDQLSAAWMHLALLRIYQETNALPRADFEARAERAIAIANQGGAVRLEMQLIYLLSAFYRSIGQMRLSRETLLRLRQIATSSDDLRVHGFACWAEAIILQMGQENEASRALLEEGRRVALPGTADVVVTRTFLLANMVLGPNPDAAREELDQMLELTRRMEDFNLIHVARLTHAVLLLRTGDLARGWAELGEIIEEMNRTGTVVFAWLTHLMRAELHLIVAGRLTPPPGGGNPPRKRPGPADLAKWIQLRLSVGSAVRRDLAAFRALCPDEGGAIEARGLIVESCLTRDRARRKALLERARTLSLEEELPNLARQAAMLLQQI